MLIRCIKTGIVLKCQQFEDGESNKTKSKISKRQYKDIYDNEKKRGLDKNASKGEGEGIGFIILLLTDLFSSLQKKLNCPTDLGKRIKSLNRLITISKID